MNKYIFVDTSCGITRHKEVLCEPQNFEQERKRMESFQWFYRPDLKEIPEYIPEETEGKITSFNIGKGLGVKVDRSLVDEGWRDTLREVKNNAGYGNTIDIP